MTTTHQFQQLMRSGALLLSSIAPEAAVHPRDRLLHGLVYLMSGGLLAMAIALQWPVANAWQLVLSIAAVALPAVLANGFAHYLDIIHSKRHMWWGVTVVCYLIVGAMCYHGPSIRQGRVVPYPFRSLTVHLHVSQMERLVNGALSKFWNQDAMPLDDESHGVYQMSEAEIRGKMPFNCWNPAVTLSVDNPRTKRPSALRLNAFSISIHTTDLLFEDGEVVLQVTVWCNHVGFGFGYVLDGTLVYKQESAVHPNGERGIVARMDHGHAFSKMYSKAGWVAKRLQKK